MQESLKSAQKICTQHIPSLWTALKKVRNPFKLRHRCFYSPYVLLSVFMFLNFLTYFDRGLLAGALPQIQIDSLINSQTGPSTHAETLTQQQLGGLVSTFMGGYMVSAPVFACAESLLSSANIIRFSIMLYMLGAVLTSFSSSYSSLLAARAMVGIGQGGYASFVTTIIDAIAPLESRTMFLGAYFGMIVIGPAIGIVVGGSTSPNDIDLHDPLDTSKFSHDTTLPEAALNLSQTGSTYAPWRIPFLLEAIAMMPIFAFMLLYSDRRQKKNLRRRKQSYIDSLDKESTDIISHNLTPKRKKILESFSRDLDSEASEKDVPRMKDSILELLRCKQFLLTTIGYCGLTFVFGALSVYVLPFLSSHPLYPLKSSTASVYLGSVTVLTGMIGTATGSFILDRVLGGSEGKHGLARCHLLNSICVLLAFPCGLCAFFVAKSYKSFFAFLALAEFFVFMATAPINAATLSSAPAMNVRTLAVSLSIFFIHCFGDFPSPIVVGGLIDRMTYKHTVCSAYTSLPGEDSSELSSFDPFSRKGRCEATSGVTYQCRWLPSKYTSDGTPSQAEIQFYRENTGQCINVYSIRNSLVLVTMLWLLSILVWVIAFVLVAKEIKNQRVFSDTITQEPLIQEDIADSEEKSV